MESIAGNNLNAIRLALALAVILSHSFPLSLGAGGEAKGDPLYALTQMESCGGVAVNLFFFISGMLITASWLNSKSMQHYLMKRVLRIYPGYIVATAFSGLLIWLFCPEFRAHAGHGISWAIMMANDWVRLDQKSLGWEGVFSGNPLPQCANGSLWTIPLEFSCYMSVLWLGLFSLFRFRWLILAAALGIYCKFSYNLLAGYDAFHLDSRFWTYFFGGACFWLWRDKIPFSGRMAWVGLALLLVASQIRPWFSVLEPVFGSYAVLWLGYGLRLPCLQWTQKTDLSYGTYLYAFPVQQVLAMNESLRHPWLLFLLSAPVTLLLAWMSWHWVEKRFLAIKNRGAVP